MTIKGRFKVKNLVEEATVAWFGQGWEGNYGSAGSRSGLKTKGIQLPLFKWRAGQLKTTACRARMLVGAVLIDF